MSHAHETLAAVNEAIDTRQGWPISAARAIIAEIQHVPDLTAAVIVGRDVLAMLEGGDA